MKLSLIVATVALIGCGPAFTEAAPDAGQTVEVVVADTGNPSTVDAGRMELDAQADSATSTPDAGRDAVVDATKTDAGAPDAEAPNAVTDAAPDVAAPTPRCDGVEGLFACTQWGTTGGHCDLGGEALCCRSDGLCGCRVTMNAACE